MILIVGPLVSSAVKINNLDIKRKGLLPILSENVALPFHATRTDNLFRVGDRSRHATLMDHMSQRVFHGVMGPYAST